MDAFHVVDFINQEDYSEQLKLRIFFYIVVKYNYKSKSFKHLYR